TPASRDSALDAAVAGLLSGRFAGHRPESGGDRKAEHGAKSVGGGEEAARPPAPRPPHLTPRRNYWPTVARPGIQVAEAMAFAHAQGVIHRDVKPSNLLLDPQGTVWVTDFGLAKEAATANNLTASGFLIGTLRYVPPERFSGQADARGDVYGLGLALYELLTRRPAFDAVDRSKLMVQVMHTEPPRPRQLNPAVPYDLETVVLQALAPD